MRDENELIEHFQAVQISAQTVLGETNVDACLYVDSKRQVLEHWQHGRLVCCYMISTARNGLGCEADSFCTPIGLHRIAEKIGADADINSIFVGRQQTGEVACIESASVDTGTDQITSRILWLDGLEDGVNRGGNLDSYTRYIYIHGTDAEGMLGQAVSHGCVRMGNTDIVRLFGRVKLNTLVFIA